jgi:predicted nucleic acid-binding protein
MIFFDSYAIVITNALHLSEVFYSMLKVIDKEKALKILRNLEMEFIKIDEDIAIEAAIFRKNNSGKKLSYADCIGYVSARKNNLKFLTGDKEFESFEGVEFVKG